MAEDRSLIVNADDFGRSPGINRGIIEAHEHGIVTSASLMVRWPAAIEAAAYARKHPNLSLGLHFDFGEWAYRDETWVRVYDVINLSDAVAVADEVSRQLAAFRQLVGKDPTHLDSHQHVHRSEPVASLLVDIARKRAVPLRHYSSEICYCGEFYGQTSNGFPVPEGITVVALIKILKVLPPGFTELNCHPGEVDGCDTMYRAERAEEMKVLCDARIRAAISAENIKLRSFHDVQGGVQTDAAFQARSFNERGTEAYQRGDFRQAEAWFRRLSIMHDSRPSTWLWLARAQLKLQNLEGSFESVCKALELQPDWPLAMQHLEDLLAREDQRTKFLELLEQLRLRDERNVEVARLVTKRMLQMKAYPTGMRAAEALLQLDPEDEDGLLAKAVGLWKLGDTRGSTTLVDSKLKARTPSATRLASHLYLEVGDPLTAWSIIEPLADEIVEQKLLIRIAQNLWANGYIKAPCKAFERAAARDPEDALLRHWRDTALGESQVLGGVWESPTLKVENFEPVRGRILHLVGQSLPYTQVGYTIRTHYLAQSQKEAGLDPQVVTPLGFPWDQGAEQVTLYDEIDGVRYHWLPPIKGIPSRLDERLSLNVLQLSELVRRVRPSVLHAASDYLNALPALALGRAFRLPVVYEVRGFWEDDWLSKQDAGARSRDRYLRWRERELQCMIEADRVVTLAEVMKEQIVERGVPAEKIVVIPNAVDTRAFVPVDRDPALAESLGLKPDEVVIGYISTFSPFEGIRFLIDAVAKLIHQGHRVRALLVGDGKERGHLEAMASALGIADKVIFTGQVPHADILRYYGLIDVFVVPRTVDRISQLVTPLKPLEAMATGRALAVSEVQALREMVEDGVTGLVFTPEDSGHLAGVVETLIKDKNRREALGRTARDWVCQHRTWDQNGQRYLELYGSLGVM